MPRNSVDERGVFSESAVRVVRQPRVLSDRDD